MKLTKTFKTLVMAFLTTPIYLFSAFALDDTPDPGKTIPNPNLMVGNRGAGTLVIVLIGLLVVVLAIRATSRRNKLP